MFFEDFRNANGLDDVDFQGLQDGFFGETDQKGSGGKETTGRWTREEHLMFIKGLEMYGKGWKKIAGLIKTRTVVQIRTHAQKYFLKLSKARQILDSNGGGSVDGKIPSSGSRKRIKRREGDQIGLSVALQPFIKKPSGEDKTIDVDECLFNFLSPKLPPSGYASATSSTTPDLLGDPPKSGRSFGGAQDTTTSSSSASAPMKTFDEMLSQNMFDGNGHVHGQELNADAKRGYVPATGSSDDAPSPNLDGSGEISAVVEPPPRPRIVVDTPAWFRQGADLESLLQRADSLDWLGDSGVPVAVDEPTTDVIVEAAPSAAAMAAAAMAASSVSHFTAPGAQLSSPTYYNGYPYPAQPIKLEPMQGTMPVGVFDRSQAGLQHCASSSSVSSPAHGYSDAARQFQFASVSPRQDLNQPQTPLFFQSQHQPPPYQQPQYQNGVTNMYHNSSNSFHGYPPQPHPPGGAAGYGGYPQPYTQVPVPVPVPMTVAGDHAFPPNQSIYNTSSSSSSGMPYGPASMYPPLPSHHQFNQPPYPYQQQQPPIYYPQQQMPPQQLQSQYPPQQQQFAIPGGFVPYVNTSATVIDSVGGMTHSVGNSSSMPSQQHHAPQASSLPGHPQQLDTESELKAHLLGLSDDDEVELVPPPSKQVAPVDLTNALTTAPTQAVTLSEGGATNPPAAPTQEHKGPVAVKEEPGSNREGAKPRNHVSDHTEDTVDMSDVRTISSHGSPVSNEAVSS